MSMSTHVTGFAPPDERWQKMKAAWDACRAAGVAVPVPVQDFFGDEDPDPAGVEVDLPVREWNGGLAGAGYELDVSAIPSQVKIIRFYNSW
jgi:hypothetical protein